MMPGYDSYTVYAGSAIAQGPNVGRIDRWRQWKPIGTLKPLWLLLAGATDPPKSIEISERRTRDSPGDKSGAFLAGVKDDLKNMEGAVGTALYNVVRDLHLKKYDALAKIESLFDECQNKGSKPMLYYTGHGEVGTGDWCFRDGKIGIEEIFNMVPGGAYYPMIFSDACYSGHWANFCLDRNIEGFHCLAACPEYSAAIDTKDEGGDLTLFMTGKKDRPSTEPIYSGGNRKDSPINPKFDCHSYTDLVTGHIQNTQRILITQSMHNGHLSAQFATSQLYTPKPASTWGMLPTYDTFFQFVKKKREEEIYIYSLAWDEKFGFGVFLMKGFGTCQIIIPTDNPKKSAINKKLVDGFHITTCAARDSIFYVIMTKDTTEYKDKTQNYFTCWTRTEVNSTIRLENRGGFKITGICYSSELCQYFVVTTKSSEKQCYRFFGDNNVGYAARGRWEDEKFKKGFSITIIFKDPTDNKILLVMAKVEDTSACNQIYNCRLRQETPPVEV